MQTSSPIRIDKRGNKNGIPKKEEKGIATRLCKSMHLEMMIFIKSDNPYDAPKENRIDIKPFNIDSFKYMEHISDSLAPKQLKIALIL